MKRIGAIRALVVSGLLLTVSAVPFGIAGAQGMKAAPVAALPTPRLVFSDAEMRLARAISGQPGLADYYGSNGLQQVFTGTQAAARRAALIAAVGDASSHGLPPARYAQAGLIQLQQQGNDGLTEELAFATVFQRWTHDITGGLLDPSRIELGIHRQVQRPATGQMLRDFVAAPDPAAWLAQMAPSDPRYLALRKALMAQPAFNMGDSADPVPAGTWREGMSGPAIRLLRDNLAAAGFTAVALTDPQDFDAPLTGAVAQFQAKAGLPADGVAGPRTIARLNRGPGGNTGPILVAMERLRWMHGQDPAARQVWVNLPEFTARILENGEEQFSTKVVIGKADPEYETPEFTETMKYIVVNPRWNVPRSITVKEYLPRLQANRNAVSQLDVVDGKGNVIARDRIDFRKYTAANFPFRMRQKPSDDNALGQVKFMFPNPWNIYLHDTPTKHLFNEQRRAYSHGCIRIGRPIDLAHALLEGQVSNPDAVFSKALDSGRETYLNLRAPLPVHLVYFTAFPDASGQIRHFPDIYGRDALVQAALQKAARQSGLDFAGLAD